MTEHEARVILIKAGYNLDPEYAYYMPVVTNGNYDEVAKLLQKSGYQGKFAVKKTSRKKS